MNQLIRCKNCDELIMRTPFDQYPEYELEPGRSAEQARTIERNDFQDFLIHHHGHHLENLKIIEDSVVSDQPYLEPIKTSFFRATNGREKFVVKKYREKMDEPLKYQLVFGDYVLQMTTLAIQEEEIRKQCQRELKPAPSQAQMEAFLKLYRRIVQDLAPGQLERVPEESSHPLEIYYKIDDVHLMFLLRNCRTIFKGQEYSAIEEFIYRHKDDGVLLLKATYAIILTEMAQPKKETMATPLRLKKEKRIEKK